MVGIRIRELRSDRGMTLTGLARSTGLSAGLISQVERGLTDPSLETLRRIARVLDVPLFSLFRDAEPDSDAVVVRRDRRMQVSSPHGGISYQRLSPGSGKLELLEGTLEPGAASSAKPWSHPSEECVTVLSGQLLVEIGSARHDLETGDSCYFDSRSPHRYVNPTERRTVFLVAITPPSF
ncbi:helix-turn-helix domain-containing protein [Pseudonocardia kunmingensis]|uniref:XRE family transcriptional regulator n=1 Tax=Pseudonocardia kunmingensis TaxID=630975 RepID=A0A543DJV4_9PSEU|nr:cupin domain-containing protein [Pseudonocardia kunmingensis]TQM09603.1 XRE family transcriptional regulator [Pseudonocardia kunmingensis]